MRVLGAAMIIAAFGGAGLAASGELDRRFRLLRELKAAAERMRTLVCLDRLALPEALWELAKAYPTLFGATEEISSALGEASFPELWIACVERIAPPAEAASALRQLGEALLAGEEPTRVFERALGELSRAEEASRRRREQDLRLYPAVGLSLGCLLAIVLV